MIRTTNAALYGYHHGNDGSGGADADWVIPGQDFTITFSERGQKLKDTSKLAISNKGGKYTGEIRHRDRFEFHAETPVESTKGIDTYGGGEWGGSTYGGGLAHRWTGRMRSFEIDALGGESYGISADAEDFVYGEMGSHRWYASVKNQDLTGHEDAILERAIDESNCPIDPSGIEDVGAKTSFESNGDTILEVLHQVLSRSDSIAFARDQTLYVRPTSTAVTALNIEKGSHHWVNPTFKSNDDKLVNVLRTLGGTAPKVEPGGILEGELDHYVTVTDTNRLKVQIDIRKDELDQVDIWTDNLSPNTTPSSEDDLMVRVQRSINGAPVDVDDTKSDLVNRTIDYHFLKDKGWTNFELSNDHSLYGTEDPWLIIEAGGQDGQNVGVNVDGDPLHVPYFAYPVNSHKTKQSSIDKYGESHHRIKDETLRTIQGVSDFADAYVDLYGEPERTISWEADSTECHGLRIGDVINIRQPALDADGEFIIVERKETFKGSTVTTDFTAIDRAGGGPI